MALTEEQIVEAQAELRRRDRVRSEEYTRECARRQAEAEEKHMAEMRESWPGISDEDFWNIYYAMRDFNE